MTEIEKKALALVNATFLEPRYDDWAQLPQGSVSKALIRAIEQHEAFAQEVSDAVKSIGASGALLSRFIIQPVDPLVEVAEEMRKIYCVTGEAWAKAIRTAMQARGYEWRKIGEGA